MRLGSMHAMENLRSGDAISDTQLDNILEELPPVVQFLWELGPEYRLPWRQLMNDLNQLQGFKDARERDKK